MTARAAVHITQMARPSARVKTVAQLLDCDESQVRRLIQDGQLEAHRMGIRGIRVYLDSLEAYRQQRPVAGRRTVRPQRKPLKSKAETAAHAHAMEELRRAGLI